MKPIDTKMSVCLLVLMPFLAGSIPIARADDYRTQALSDAIRSQGDVQSSDAGKQHRLIAAQTEAIKEQTKAIESQTRAIKENGFTKNDSFAFWGIGAGIAISIGSRRVN